ncbi:MAG: anhydro-N-acetylmuramic acid kinase, partial [Spirochaetia bacterium]|nr:anhydro-N-acetylmuramic acid kinase [Spirochaetia bacterium]
MESEKTASSLFRLSAYQSRHEHALIGIMSGTSFDGIDAVLVRIMTDERGHIASLAMEGHYSLPYSQELQKRLLALCSPETARIDELVYAHAALAEWYAGAVEGLLGMAGRKAQDVYAICLHGQTVWHAPVPRAFPGPSGQPVAARGTLQIGSAPLLHERTGIPVIYDFRSRDMAAGGEGAPLAPFVDALLFGSLERGRIVQNIGGIGNATVIPAGAGNEAVFAFDTGPGNMVMDELAKRFSNGALAYD